MFIYRVSLLSNWNTFSVADPNFIGRIGLQKRLKQNSANRNCLKIKLFLFLYKERKKLWVKYGTNRTRSLLIQNNLETSHGYFVIILFMLLVNKKGKEYLTKKKPTYLNSKTGFCIFIA